MEVVLHHQSPCCLRLKLVEKKSSLYGLRHFPARRNQVFCSTSISSIRSLKRSNVNHLQLKNLNHREVSSSTSLHGFRVAHPKASNESCTGYVIDGEEGLRDISENAESIPKVLIPPLPDESNGCRAPTSSCYWEWKPKLNVYYEKSGCGNINAPPVLLLPGFGVGSFHYQKQLEDLGRDFRVWAVDFLGQGMSLPMEDPAPLPMEEDLSDGKDFTWGFGDKTEPWANELVYSVDLWKDQVRFFIEQVIGEPVYIVGNSLGGFVALYFAALNPELVRGITLLNATPFWGFLPNPVTSPLLVKLFPWAGTFPLPANVRKLTELVWQKISDPRSIADVLKQVYADHSTNIDKIFSRILETTEHPAAAAAFASIMFAPTGQLSFRESLTRCREKNVPICLMYGKEDPWVKPVWGYQVKRQIPDAPYYEMSPAGHCPHDEVPEVVNYLLRGWIKNVESGGSVALPLLDDAEAIDYDLTKNLEFVREGSKKLVKIRYFGSNFSIWNQIRSLIKARLKNLVIKPRQLDRHLFHLFSSAPLHTEPPFASRQRKPDRTLFSHNDKACEAVGEVSCKAVIQAMKCG
ncbi:hypothetical protein Nepgr_006238 [Nepenthes gracilis]|uniref:AB hydrolase-1 domain-containing protein n=1 Tax=Nepenthes gracilis TaxID=150966 RepID=A0AAD3S4M8_NEPGR|nr:hypothetical protein Nepgr_006238 [Nepenthes gracilis]